MKLYGCQYTEIHWYKQKIADGHANRHVIAMPMLPPSHVDYFLNKSFPVAGSHISWGRSRPLWAAEDVWLAGLGFGDVLCGHCSGPFHGLP